MMHIRNLVDYPLYVSARHRESRREDGDNGPCLFITHLL